MFFFTGAGPFRAAVGVKSVIIVGSENLTLDGRRPVESEAKRVGEIRELLSGPDASSELTEEWDHFQCLRFSTAATSLHIRNVLTRWAHSRELRSLAVKGPIRSSAISSTLFAAARYHLDYALFHATAMPWLEGRVMSAGLDVEALPLAAPFVKRVLSEVRASEEFRAPNGHAAVGRCVDREVVRAWAAYPETLAEELSASNATTRHPAFLVFWTPVVRRTFDPKAWPSIVHVIRRSGGVLPAHLFRRVFPMFGARRVPGLLSKHGDVDPIAFRAGIQAFSSPEIQLSSEHKAMNDLHWFFGSRIAFCTVWTLLGASSTALLRFLENVNRFYSEWVPSGQSAAAVIADWTLAAYQAGARLGETPFDSYRDLAKAIALESLGLLCEEVSETTRPDVQRALVGFYQHA